MPPNQPPSVSKVISKVVYSPTAGDVESGEETEIAAQITIPQDGGWGWIVLSASFISTFIIEGVIFTYGTILKDVAKDLRIPNSLAALVNSIQTALYYMTSPMASALINRFGFRASIMIGSIISSIGLLVSYFCTNLAPVIVFYGVVHAFGSALINMSASLVVGFYFERLRTIALSITSMGSSVGVMVMFPLNAYLCQLSDWRSTTLFHSGLLGICYFLGLTYRPLLSMTVMQTEDETNPTKTVTFLPNLADAPSKNEGAQANITERMFRAVSVAHFPTAAAVVGSTGTSATPGQPGTSSAPTKSKLQLVANGPQGAISRQQLKLVQSIVSRPNMQDKIMPKIGMQKETPSKTRCCGRCCQWEEQTEIRPIYRDDVFYTGKLDKLPTYQKSVMETIPEERTGLEYQLAVTRAVTVNDLQDKKGLCTTATRRALASMMDPTLLRKPSFLLICFSGMLTSLGLMVPYVFLPDRNHLEGVDPKHCSLFVSAIGLGSIIGRLIFGVLANYLDPIKICGYAVTLAGVTTILSSISFNLYYQYFYSLAFGIFISGAGGLRSIVLVSVFGLEKLTNAMGMAFVFLGIGTLISTPTAGFLKEQFGYAVSFYVSGAFIAASGVVMLFVRILVTREAKKEAAKQKVPNFQKKLQIAVN